MEMSFKNVLKVPVQRPPIKILKPEGEFDIKNVTFGSDYFGSCSDNTFSETDYQHKMHNEAKAEFRLDRKTLDRFMEPPPTASATLVALEDEIISAAYNH